MIRVEKYPVAMYFASIVVSATQTCFLLFHDIKLQPSRWKTPLVLKIHFD